MYMSKITPDLTVAAPEADGPKGGIALGIAVLAIAVPYWVARLFAGALWRDVRGVGRYARLCASAYAEALRRR